LCSQRGDRARNPTYQERVIGEKNDVASKKGKERSGRSQFVKKRTKGSRAGDSERKLKIRISLNLEQGEDLVALVRNNQRVSVGERAKAIGDKGFQGKA